MEEILSNVMALTPFLLGSWGLLLLMTFLRPQRYSNSFLLMIAGGMTLLFIAGLFGEEMPVVLIIIFLLILMVLLSVPFILMYNGIVMLKKESWALAHFLSLLLGLVIAIGELAVFYSFLGAVRGGELRPIIPWAFLIGMTVFYGSCLVLNFVLYSVYIQILPHRHNFQYIIIHGCGIRGDGQLTPILKARVDKAMEIYRKCRVSPMIIPSGGKGDDEPLSEAQAMCNYMVEHGIPREQILLEDRSTTTMENLIFSKLIMDNRAGAKKTALISSNYHVYRCLVYAKKLGMKCVGIGSKVALYFWPTALLREFAAIFRQKRYLILTSLGYALLLLMWLILYIF